jgi:hypothetical protein
MRKLIKWSKRALTYCINGIEYDHGSIDYPLDVLFSTKGNEVIYALF